MANAATGVNGAQDPIRQIVYTDIETNQNVR
jgi:hypothetical protein